MLETLLASRTIGAPWPRAVMAALLLHVLLIVAAVSTTASLPANPPVAARDTIRLAIAGQAVRTPPKSAESPPSRAEAVIPEAPPLPDLRADVPDFQPPRLKLSQPAGPSLSRTLLHWSSGALPASRDSSPRVLSAIEVDELPELTEELRPLYPEELRRAGVSGLVLVQYVVGIDGRMDWRTIRVLVSSHQAFLLAALDALRDSRFKPACRGGRPVAVLVQQTIRFEYR